MYLAANTNDNIVTRSLYMGEAECLPHIPAVRYLIQEYVSEYWKHDDNDIGFVDMELTLCRYLLMPTESIAARTLKIKWVARILGVHPLVLHNDPSLPF